MNTKYFAILFFVASVAANAVNSPIKLIDPVGPIREKCRVQTHMTVDALANGVHTPEQIGPYLICFGHATGVLTKDGEISKKAIYEASKENLPIVILKPMIEVCVGEVTLGRVLPIQLTDVQKMLIFSNCVKNVLGGELLRLTGYCQPPTWPRLDNIRNAHQARAQVDVEED